MLAADEHPAETLVYRADGSESLPSPQDVLDGEEVLPGFRCPLADLF